ARIITDTADPAAKIIFGAVIDDKMKDQIKITVVATGFDGKSKSSKVELKSYTPNPFVESENEKESTPASALWGNKKAKIPTIKNIPLQPLVEKRQEKMSEPEKTEEDDLSVPAFIRKKMSN
ncbi:MAG TPA: hypothetical protein PK837_01195, partial [bacterium]|nr:hypothetical protein [bacterium]